MANGKLICFEGIDGSGKTTIAERVNESLCAGGARAIFVKRRGLDYPKGYQRRRMTLYHQVIWEYGDDPIHELGDLHSLYIMAGWFAVLDRCKVRPLLREYDYVVMDNWYYKFAARYALKPGVDFQHVLDCFGHLTVPDLVAMLDVSPAIAADRKDSFNLAEAGLLDGFTGDPRESFVRYQGAVRERLLRFAKDNHWLVLANRSADHDDVVARIVAAIQADDAAS